ncbi:MAG: TetR/AcrR family transcriptional regulator [Rhizobiaceae bacterium]|nr:TetR/AcrR family transcriptional regulator [Rhizobiaceae bacterium]
MLDKLNTHHHGNLHEALIVAGIELLNEGGMHALTLRKCAARAGVSHAAPAHHFDGLNGLLAAIVARGFQQFTEAMVGEREKAAKDPFSILCAICRGYLKFAITNEALFNLMFSPQMQDLEDNNSQRELPDAYQVLRDACAPFKHGSNGAAGTELMVWSLVHGFAQLTRKNRVHPDKHTTDDTNFDNILRDLKLELV